MREKVLESRIRSTRRTNIPDPTSESVSIPQPTYHPIYFPTLTPKSFSQAQPQTETSTPPSPPTPPPPHPPRKNKISPVRNHPPNPGPNLKVQKPNQIGIFAANFDPKKPVPKNADPWGANGCNYGQCLGKKS